MKIFNMLLINSSVNLSTRELIVLNYLLILYFIVISTSSCIEFQPPLSNNLNSSRVDNASYNLNSRYPVGDTVDFIITNNSSLPKINNLQFSQVFPTSSDVTSTSNSVLKEGDICKHPVICDHPAICINNTCQCKTGYVLKSKFCLKGKSLFKNCLFSEECQVKNSECSSGKCRCQEKYEMYIKENKVTCLNKNVTKGMFCEDDFDCLRNETKMRCINNKCDCDNKNIYVNLYQFRLHWKSHWILGKCYEIASYHDKCETNEECQATDRNMICRHGLCDCSINYKYIKPTEQERGKCYRKASRMYDSCEQDEQCFGVSNKAVCSRNNNLCVCRLGYYNLNEECIRQEEFERSKAQQVYRTAMIAAACFMIGIVSIFVVCIVKKSFCGDDNRSTLPGGQLRSNSQLQRMTSLTEDGIIVADKPPSYEEIILAEIPTTPPPKYTDISKLFPITEGLQRHSSEPHLNIPYLESGHNRSNSFHAYDNLAASNDANNIEIASTPPPKYEECPSSKPRPNLHLNIPSITISVDSPTDETTVQHQT